MTKAQLQIILSSVLIWQTNKLTGRVNKKLNWHISNIEDMTQSWDYISYQQATLNSWVAVKILKGEVWDLNVILVKAMRIIVKFSFLDSKMKAYDIDHMNSLELLGSISVF